MGLDLGKIRRRQEEARSKGTGGGGFWKPKEGRNLVRIFTFKHEVTKNDVSEGLFPQDALGKTVDELDRPVTLHFNVDEKKSPVISVGRNAPVMALYHKLRGSKDKDDLKRAQEIRPVQRHVLNVVDIQAEEQKMVVWTCPKTVYSTIAGYVTDPDYGASVLGAKGRDFVITFDPKAEGADMYDVKIRPEGKSEEVSKEVAKCVMDLYDAASLSTVGRLDVTVDVPKSNEDDDLEVDADEDDDEDEEPKSKNE